jgi:hypothetical protein
MYIAMTSDSVTPGQLYDYASTQVGQRLSILPGVSQVGVYGTKSGDSNQGQSRSDVGAQHFNRRSQRRDQKRHQLRGRGAS